MGVGESHDTLSALLRKVRIRPHFLPPPCEDTEKAAVYKPGREVSPGSKSANTLTSWASTLQNSEK